MKSIFAKPTMHLIKIIASIIVAHPAFSQHDSLILKNKDVIVGEIKSLDKGVLTIETGYSKSDFTVEWSGIKEIYSKTTFLVTLKDGSRINGAFRSDSLNKIIITDVEGKKTETTLENIVYLKGVKSSFWSRVHANIDAGLSITKANNLKQYNVRSGFGYLADKWSAGRHQAYRGRGIFYVFSPKRLVFTGSPEHPQEY
jgi:hypothetical protein